MSQQSEKSENLTDKLLIVVSGPSGVGKGTVVKELVKNEKYALSISCTTRKPRPGEEDGKDYFFKTNAEFEEMISQNNFLEYAGYCDHYYGTPKDYVLKKMAEGKDVILEIEVQGALQVKKNNPDAILIFVLPPSMEELKNRLSGRGTESEEVIEKRLARAAEELKLLERYDYAITNDTVENAVNEIEIISEAERKKSFRSKDILNNLK